MSDQQHYETENKLHGERYEAFLDALQTLYIKGNLSARIMFTKDWPSAATYIFGEELLRFDADGGVDRDRRAILEDEAEGRRIDLEETARKIEDLSVNKGVLQLEYVGPLVQGLGRELSLLIYSARIVDRFIPPPPKIEPEVKAETAAPAERPVAAPLPPPPPSAPLPAPVAPQEERTMAVNPMDDIMPISLEQPRPAAENPVEVNSAQARPPEASPPEVREDVVLTPAAPPPAAAPPPVTPFGETQSAPAIKPIVPKFEDLKKPPEGSA